MIIKIMSRKVIEEYAKNPFEECTAVISCRDFGANPVQLRYKPAGILWLEFDDVSLSDFADFADFDGGLPSKSELQQLKRKFHVFTAGDAKRVELFYKASKNRVKMLICQCEYGESRSAGIAAAIKQYETKDGIDIFSDEKYVPNKMVYHMVLKELNKIKS